MAIGDRSKSIYGRIYRILTKNYGFEVDKFLIGEIYDEIQQAQIQIFQRVLPERTFEITLVQNENPYPLLDSKDQEYIDKVKSVITPDDWDYEFKVVNNSKWDEILKTVTEITQPMFGTIISNEFYIHPVPTKSYNGSLLTLITNQKLPDTVISSESEIDPELSNIFDKEMEWVALFNLTNDNKWIELYEANITKKLGKGQTNATEELVKDCEW